MVRPSQEDLSKLRNLERVLRPVLRQLQTELRWKPMLSLGVTRETVLEHTVKMAFVVHLMNLLEGMAGNPHGINFYSMLWCAITHDMGEAEFGDIDIVSKTKDDDEAEAAALNRLAKKITPPLLSQMVLPQPFDRRVGATQIEQNYWHAAEQIGYALFVSAEMQRPNISQALKDKARTVLSHYESTLASYAEDFYSVHAFYDALYPAK